jgi:hypothetical protein
LLSGERKLVDSSTGLLLPFVFLGLIFFSALFPGQFRFEAMTRSSQMITPAKSPAPPRFVTLALSAMTPRWGRVERSGTSGASI